MLRFSDVNWKKQKVCVKDLKVDDLMEGFDKECLWRIVSIKGCAIELRNITLGEDCIWDASQWQDKLCKIGSNKNGEVI